jgi:hypothetical protein
MIPRGGKREGSGRPRLRAERGETKTVYLTPTEWATALAIGDGNLSEGVRRALDAYTETQS